MDARNQTLYDFIHMKFKKVFKIHTTIKIKIIYLWTNKDSLVITYYCSGSGYMNAFTV